MKKLHYKISSAVNEGLISSYEEIMAAAMIQLEEIVCRYEYILPRGWRCILRIEDPKKVTACLDLQSNKGGGSFAEVKMKTLNNFNKAATGTDELDFIHGVIRMKGKQDATTGQEILEMTSTSEIRRSHHEWMKECLDYTNFYGAFRVPYDSLSAKVGTSMECQEGVIKVAFSGASAEQDIMFAMWTFRRIQEALVKAFPKEQFWFNLRELEEIPNIKFWIDNLGVSETV